MNLLSLAVASTLACAAPSNEKLEGLWESTSVSKGGIGHNMEFKGDGSYTAATTVLVDLKYDIKDDHFYMSHNKDEEIDYSNGAKIIITESGFTLIKNDTEEVKTKTSPSKEKTIVGTYIYEHYTGRTAYEKYTTDGEIIFRLPMESKSGCYSIKKNAVYLDGEKEDQEFKFKVSETTLDFKHKNNDRYTYKIVPEGAWYDSQKNDK